MVYEVPEPLFVEVRDLIGRLPSNVSWHLYGALLQLQPREEGQEIHQTPTAPSGAAGEPQGASS